MTHRNIPTGTDSRLRIYPAHSFSHDDDLQALIDLLEPDWVQYRDYVITAPRTQGRLETGGDTVALLVEMIELIATSDVVWMLAGGYSSRSAFIEFESIVTDLLRKPVHALPWHGQKRLSTVATRDGDREVVRRNRRSIIEATLKAIQPSRRRQFEAWRDGDPLAPLTSAPLSWLTCTGADHPYSQVLAATDGGILGAILEGVRLGASSAEASDADPLDGERPRLDPIAMSVLEVLAPPPRGRRLGQAQGVASSGAELDWWSRKPGRAPDALRQAIRRLLRDGGHL